MCRRRKLRCDRESPCSNCRKSGSSVCVFDAFPPVLKRKKKAPTPDQAASGPSPSQTAASAQNSPPGISPPQINAALTPADSIKNAYEVPGQHSARPVFAVRGDDRIPAPVTRSETRETQGLGQQVHITHLLGADSLRSISQAVYHKNRLSGQSHWLSAVVLYLDFFNTIERYVRMGGTEMFAIGRKCKMLTSRIKQNLLPAWPPASSQLPSKHIADELVNRYMETSESLYRVVHIQSFYKSYAEFWESPDPDPGFVIQLKLILAIGTVTYDESFSLRRSAIQWIYEGCLWAAAPHFKKRLSIQALQNSILLLLAREACAIGHDLVWISAGELLRKAMSMGFARDPSILPKGDLFNCEMRRRLWNTVLELNVNSCMNLGTSPHFMTIDSDTAPPANLDDKQLMTQDSKPAPEGVITQMSVPLALRRTLGCRLLIASILNNPHKDDTYEQRLELDVDLRNTQAEVRKTLKGIDPNRFDVRAVDSLVNRYLMCLHIPFFSVSVTDIKFAYSRKIMVDSATRLWNLATKEATTGGSYDPFQRWVKNSSGFFKNAAFSSLTLFAAELKALAIEQQKLGPALPLPSDLTANLEAGDKWSWDVLSSGENSKGVMIIGFCRAQIDSIQKAMEPDEGAMYTITAGQDALKRCMALLEEKAAASGAGDQGPTPPEDQMAAMDFGQMDFPVSMENMMFGFENVQPLDFESMEDTVYW